MKHIKIYENFNEKPKIGDYILANIDHYFKEYEDFINKTIGQIIDIRLYSEIDDAIVEYENIPDNIKHVFHMYSHNDILYHNNTEIKSKDIKYFAKTKKEIEELITVKKYNL